MKPILAAFILAACSVPALLWAGDNIPFSQLPPCVQAAVYRAAPGIRVEEVEIEQKRGWTVFEVEGHCRRYEYEILVTPTGQILKFERERR